MLGIQEGLEHVPVLLNERDDGGTALVVFVGVVLHLISYCPVVY